jgi:hypothetical protein
MIATRASPLIAKERWIGTLPLVDSVPPEISR